MTNLSAPALITDQEAVLQVFQAAAHPLTVPQAEKLYQGPKLTKKQWAQIVEEQLLMQGQLFKCSPGARNAPRYWAQDEAEKVRDKVEELLTEQDLDEKKLTTAVNKALPKISSPAAIKDHLQTMHREGLVHERPGKGKAKTKLLSLRPSRPDDAVSFTPATLKNLSKALEEVKSFGGSVERFLQIICERLRCTTPTKALPPEQERNDPLPPEARNGQEEGHSTVVDEVEPAPPVEIDNLILKGMYDLESAVDQGASVLVRNLRRHMPAEYRGHDTFDAAVFRLADEEKIVLHRHDQPSCLTETERDELVHEEGTYYVSIAKRV